MFIGRCVHASVCKEIKALSPVLLFTLNLIWDGVDCRWVYRLFSWSVYQASWSMSFQGFSCLWLPRPFTVLELKVHEFPQLAFPKFWRSLTQLFTFMCFEMVSWVSQADLVPQTHPELCPALSGELIYAGERCDQIQFMFQGNGYGSKMCYLRSSCIGIIACVLMYPCCFGEINETNRTGILLVHFQRSLILILSKMASKRVLACCLAD